MTFFFFFFFFFSFSLRFAGVSDGKEAIEPRSQSRSSALLDWKMGQEARRGAVLGKLSRVGSVTLSVPSVFFFFFSPRENIIPFAKF